MSLINISSILREYKVHFGPISEYIDSLCKMDNRVFIVDDNVWNCYAENLLKPLPRSDTFTFPAVEDQKNLEGVKTIYDLLLERSAKRNITLITIGGGILQDVTGFVASTMYRGINWILIPTTLLAQADSCIGSKTSLNYKNYKNLIGSFYPPSMVWVDPIFLKTLKKTDFYSGLGEVIKLHLMGGKQKTDELLHSLESILSMNVSSLETAVKSSLEIKLDFISNDEFDLGRRNMLNYGHCIGHALESVTNFRIPHGQAVIIGILLANRIANKRGLLSNEKMLFIGQQLLLPAIVVDATKEELQAEPIIIAMGKDKKRIGAGLALIMLLESGEMTRVNDLTPEEVHFAVNWYRNLLK